MWPFLHLAWSLTKSIMKGVNEQGQNGLQMCHFGCHFKHCGTETIRKYIRTVILLKGRGFGSVDQILFDRFNIKLTRRRLFSPAINIT